MLKYADIDYYNNNYLLGREAVINASLFPFHATRATQLIKHFTFGNIDEANIPDEVKMCCCELAEVIYKADKSRHSGKTSEKTGEASVSYESDANIDAKLEKDTVKTIYNWLADTGLLYRGV